MPLHTSNFNSASHVEMSWLTPGGLKNRVEKVLVILRVAAVIFSEPVPKRFAWHATTKNQTIVSCFESAQKSLVPLVSH